MFNLKYFTKKKKLKFFFFFFLFFLLNQVLFYVSYQTLLNFQLKLWKFLKMFIEKHIFQFKFIARHKHFKFIAA